MLIKVFIGILAGIISGLFSTGGGMILVPAFVHFLKIDDKKARATSIVCILFMVITTSVFYLKNNYLKFELGLQCAIGGMIGSLIGSKLLNRLPTYILKIIFIIFIIYIAFKFIL